MREYNQLKKFERAEKQKIQYIQNLKALKELIDKNKFKVFLVVPRTVPKTEDGSAHIQAVSSALEHNIMELSQGQNLTRDQIIKLGSELQIKDGDDMMTVSLDSMRSDPAQRWLSFRVSKDTAQS